MAVDPVGDDRMQSLPWPSAGRAWWTIGCLVMAAFICTMDRLVLNILVDPIKTDLGITEVQFSLLQGVSFTAINSIALLPLGLLTDKTSRRNLLIFGIFIWSLATMLSGFAQNYGQFLTARICVGMGEAALWPVAVSMIADLLPANKRGRAVSLVLLGQIVGGGTSLILTKQVISLKTDGFFDTMPVLDALTSWRLIMVLWGTLGAIVIGMLLTAPEPIRRVTHRAQIDVGGIRAFVRHLRQQKSILMPIYIAAVGIAIGSYSLAAWVPAFFMRHFHVSPSALGPTLGTMSILSGILGALAAGFLSDRAERSGRPDRKFLIPMAATLLCLPGTLLAFAPSLMAGIVIQGVTVIFYPVVAVVMTVIVLDLVPNEMRGKAQAMLTLFGGIGATLGPTLTSMATEYIYEDDQAVGFSLMTVLIPTLAITAFCFYSARQALLKRQSGSDMTLATMAA